ncbi:MAG: ABC transporter substrate-binding protein [Geminicoccaceae bacterium]
MTFKTLLLGTAATVLIAGTAAANDLTVVSWGGAYTKSQVEAYHKPWMAKTGKSIISEDYNGGLAEIKAQVDAGNVTWDIVDLELSHAIVGCDEGLLEEIDPSILPAGTDGTPAEEDFIDGAINDCAVANIVWSTIFAYDKATLPEGPTALADFFDLEKFPGKRGIRKTPKANLEMALIADGVAPDEVYDLLDTDEGTDRAFAKLDSIKDQVVWWEAGAQPPQLLADGEVVMTTAYNGRIFNAAIGEGQEFEIVWDGQILDFDLWGIPKGAPNKENALDFLTFSTATEQLAAQASWISYGPARRSAGPLVGLYNDGKTEMAPHMPTEAANLETALATDAEFWADNEDELNERFSSWLAQ